MVLHRLTHFIACTELKIEDGRDIDILYVMVNGEFLGNVTNEGTMQAPRCQCTAAIEAYCFASQVLICLICCPQEVD